MQANDSLIAALTPAQRAEVDAIAIEKKVRRGEVLLEHGDDGSAMCVILEGVCKVSLTSASGKEIILDYLGPDQVVGEISLFDGEPRTASAIMVEPGRVAILQRRDVLAFLQSHPDVAIRFIRVLCGRLRKTNQLLESDRCLAMGSKLARGLLRLLADHSKPGAEASGKLGFRISQSDLGNFVSVSRENVNRQLNDWREQGFIALEGGRIDVLDADALEEIGDFCG